MKKWIVLVLTCLGASQLLAQGTGRGEVGHPFVTHIMPNTYGGSTQGFSIAQDRRGVLYFGLGSGLVEFDGVASRAIATPGNTVIRALTTDPSGRIYAGTVDDFGYLAPDKSGQMQYVSLVEFVPKEARGFQDVYSMVWTPEGLFVQAPERLLRLTPEEAPTVDRAPRKWRVKAWRPTGRLGQLSYVFGTVYSRQTGVGLMRLVGDSLELIPGGEAFLTTGGVNLVPYSGTNLNDGQILVATSRKGFFLLSRDGLRRFPTEADSMVERLGLSRLVTLKDGTFGLSLSTGGFLNLGRDGRIKIYLDRASGALLADGGLSIFTGRDGLVWLGLQKGIAKIETPSSLSRFGEASGLTGFVNDMVRHKGVLYAATMQGIYYLDQTTGMFKLVTGLPKGVSSSAFSLAVVGDRLLAPLSFLGIHEVTGTTLKQVAPNPTIGAGTGFVLHRSIYNPSRLYLGSDNMLTAYRLEPSGKLTLEGKVADSPAIRSIAESAPGTIWLGLESQGLMRVTLKGDSLKVPKSSASAPPTESPARAAYRSTARPDGCSSRFAAACMSLTPKTAASSPLPSSRWSASGAIRRNTASSKTARAISSSTWGRRPPSSGHRRTASTPSIKPPCAESPTSMSPKLTPIRTASSGSARPTEWFDSTRR